MKGDDGERSPFLDGVRAMACALVFLCHAAILACWSSRLADLGIWGVDFFLMLSGYLVYGRFPVDAKIFYIRRFFRIAPAYYVALAGAYLLAPILGELRHAAVAPQVPLADWLQGAGFATRYGVPSVLNVLSHVTLIFGIFSDQAYATPLPDWSIGLEVQLYAASPLLMASFRRNAVLTTGAVLALAAWAPLRSSFPMPAFLPLKVGVFWIGWLLAHARAKAADAPCAGGLWLAAALAIALWLGPVHLGAMSGAFAAVLVAPVLSPRLAWRAVAGAIERLCAARWIARLACVSYGFYLVHLLVLIPAAGLLSRLAVYRALPAAARFAVLVTVAGPPALAVAGQLFDRLERPALRWSRRLWPSSPVTHRPAAVHSRATEPSRSARE